MYKCDSCGRELKYDALYDEQTEQYFCDARCLQDWMMMNWDEVFNRYLELYTYFVYF